MDSEPNTNIDIHPAAKSIFNELIETYGLMVTALIIKDLKYLIVDSASENLKQDGDCHIMCKAALKATL